MRRSASYVERKPSHVNALLAASTGAGGGTGRFDVVVACELVYKQEWRVLHALLDTMDQLLAHDRRGACALLAYEARGADALVRARTHG